MRFILVLSLTALAACQDAGKNNNQSATVKDTAGTIQDTTAVISTAPEKDNSSAVPTSDSVPLNIQIDTVIHLAFAPGTTQLETKGTLNKKSDPVTCYLDVSSKQKLEARIVPEDGNLNIRFSQIIMPDNTSDGPFSKQLNYSLTQTGRYKIIIGPNRMADGKRSGDFVLRLRTVD